MTNPEATVILKAKLREFQNLTLLPSTPPCATCAPCPKEAESLKRASQHATTNQIVR